MPGLSEHTDRNNVDAFLTALKRGINNGLRELGEASLDEIDKEFESGVTAMGEEWDDLAQVTIEKTGPEMLQDTGDLRESFDYDVKRGRHRLKVYTENPLAVIHEHGADDKGIPRRPFLEPAARWVAAEGFNDHFEPEIDDAVEHTFITTVQV